MGVDWTAALLSSPEMAEADRLAAAPPCATVAAVPALVLMENAGRAVADAASSMIPQGGPIAVLCGPGNNGGDGFVAARVLRERGFDVRVACLVALDRLKGDAATMARRWTGPVETLTGDCAPQAIQSCALVIDALFGAGLSRPLEGAAARVVDALRASSLPVLAVDVPSGLDGTSGEARGPVVTATATVTFFRRKPGHLLMPGRRLCGRVVVADIGIPDCVLQWIAPKTFANAPGLWRAAFPTPDVETHKYARGHAVVVSGPAQMTGASRLGARGALRAGAGLVTVASPNEALLVNAANLTAIMLAPFAPPDGLADVLSDSRRNAVLIGPGAGVAVGTRRMVEIVMSNVRSGAVLDADALTSFADEPEALFRLTRAAAVATPGGPLARVVLTPHEGEFRRVFPEARGSKLERARAAAALSGATVVLKGPDTVIAAPDGRAAINENAPPWLATAGSGDVLAGLITGLMAQGMAAFEAACAAVWLHGACGERLGPGLIAEDIPEALPGVLRQVLA